MLPLVMTVFRQLEKYHTFTCRTLVQKLQQLLSSLRTFDITAPQM